MVGASVLKNELESSRPVLAVQVNDHFGAARGHSRRSDAPIGNWRTLCRAEWFKVTRFLTLPLCKALYIRPSSAPKQ